MGFNDIDTFFSGHLAWAPRWLVAVVVGIAIVLAGLALQAILIWVAGRFSRRWHPLVQVIFLRTRRLARITLALLAIDIALPLMPLPADALDTARKVMLAAFIMLVGYVAYMAVDISMERYVHGLKMDVADNLLARKAATQMRVLKRALNVLIAFITLGLALMSFDAVRQFGVSLFASAGMAGIVAGLAARPVLSNLIAGMQIAVTQPIRLDDVVVVEGEWGRIEEFTSTYVVVRIWDLRRLIVPLSYFLETPFRNWTYKNSQILGTVYLYTDYTVPVQRVREKAIALIKASPLWDGQVAGLQVTDAKETTLELRALMSANDSSKAWDLRCAVREGLIAFIQSEFPHALPRTRAELERPRKEAEMLTPRDHIDEAEKAEDGAANSGKMEGDAADGTPGGGVPGISQPTPPPEEKT
jgi:small-conductance mechanosensitive channel